MTQSPQNKPALHLGKLATLVAFALATSCVTVNVNFPETAVQRASDDFVHDLYKEKDKTEVESEPSSLTANSNTTPTAEEFNTKTPKAKALRKSMRSRAAALMEWKRKGVICEAANGLPVFKDPVKAGDQASAVAKLVKAEKKDREELYEEIEKTNKQPNVGKFFAAAFQKHSPPQGVCVD